jgi:hypothetical protein
MMLRCVVEDQAELMMTDVTEVCREQDHQGQAAGDHWDGYRARSQAVAGGHRACAVPCLAAPLTPETPPRGRDDGAARWTASPTREHPRAGGDDAIAIALDEAILGPPPHAREQQLHDRPPYGVLAATPHARGRRHCGQHRHGWLGTTPAGAGTTTYLSWKTRWRRDHPAGAGTTLSPSRACASTMDHPRVRGAR